MEALAGNKHKKPVFNAPFPGVKMSSSDRCSMPERANAEKYRYHVLSIRENPADECLIKEMWGRDAEIDITTIHSGAEALTYLQTAGRKLPNRIVLATAFPTSQMTAFEVLHALKADNCRDCGTARYVSCRACQRRSCSCRHAGPMTACNS
jgi:CheY-like chemotaxis protein